MVSWVIFIDRPADGGDPGSSKILTHAARKSLCKGRLCLSIHGAGRGDQLGAGLALFMWKLYIKYGGVETVDSREIVRGR